MPGVAAAEPAKHQCTGPRQGVSPQRLLGVGGTGGIKAAMAANNEAQADAVQAHQPKQKGA